MAIQPANPSTGELLPAPALLSPSELAHALDATSKAQRAWAALPVAERVAPLRRIAALLRADAEALANLAAREMGKPVVQGRAEVEKCATGCEYYAEHAATWLAPEPAPSDALRSHLRFDPLGIVLAVMPWNFPYWQVFRCAAPILAAGNAMLLKHAPGVPGCAQAIEDLFARAEFPAGVFRNLFVSVETTGALIAHPGVAAVTLTGSPRAGADVAAKAGAALKKCVLELGGSDPFIVLEDVDVAAVARAGAMARCLNAGQTCIAAKRFLVVESVADAFVAHLREAMEALRVGDPLDEATDVGPLARRDLLEALESQLRRTLAAGAKLVTGGRRVGEHGFHFAPTLLDGVTSAMPAAQEETFGPLAAVIRVRDAEEAIAIANASEYGLGASVWTNDVARGEAIAARIEAGGVFVNGVVKSDPRLPFGGIKRSGFGRELGVYGLREFTNVKTVWVGAPAH